jgi:ribosomal protein S18 acetylase RimI-like enzyme
VRMVMPSPLRPGGAVLIRPWSIADVRLAESAQPHLSVVSLTRRFHGGTGGGLPAAYLRHIAAGPRPEWDAQAALAGGQLCGWAEYGRRPGVWDTADLAVLVADRWQRRGIAATLIRGLVPRMICAGVRNLTVEVAQSNRTARGLVLALAGPDLPAAYADGMIRYQISLTMAPPAEGRS